MPPLTGARTGNPGSTTDDEIKNLVCMKSEYISARTPTLLQNIILHMQGGFRATNIFPN